MDFCWDLLKAEGMKAELNYFSSLALNVFKVSHSTDIIAFSFPCIISTAR